jgi:hypothetical protein
MSRSERKRSFSKKRKRERKREISSISRTFVIVGQVSLDWMITKPIDKERYSFVIVLTQKEVSFRSILTYT